MRIGLLCNEILGAHRNGGIGTATSHLALLLAHNGHSVTVCHAGSEPLDPLSPWARYYRLARVQVSPVGASCTRLNPEWMRQPVGIYEELQYRDFDVILFQDWKALGHACVVAKRTGMAFADTTLAAIAHSSTAWINEVNGTFPNSRADLALMHMEQQSVELADAVVSPSRYLAGWMREAGWKLPANTSVLPYFLSGPSLLEEAPAALEPGPRPRGGWFRGDAAHVAFFGRLEERKGIGIFLAALASEELRGVRFKVTFLGRPATKSPEEIRGFLARYRADLLDGLEFYPELSSDEAQLFLTSTGAIPVMPSRADNSPCAVYEALRLKLPFIAAAAGGIPELIERADWERCLFEPAPRALARKLSQVLEAETWPAPRAAYDEKENGARWLKWFEEQAPKKSTGAARAGRQAIDTTVVVTHFERPRLAEKTLRALAVQSDRRFDVVVVDDGSQSEAALKFLDRAARGIGGLKIRVVRQSNRYLGAARNAGVRQAEGDFVIFLDDDNVPFPNLVEVFRRAALATRADIVTCQMQFFHDATGDPDAATMADEERWAFPGGPAELGAIQNCFGDATAIYRRELFERIGGFHEIPGVTHEDWQLYLRARLAGLSLLSLPVPLFWYRVTPDSMSRTTSLGANMRVVASALHEKLPRSLSRMADFMIGSHSPGAAPRS